MALKLYAPGERRNNRYYVVRGRLLGEQYEFSTETTDKKAAERIKAEFEARIRSGEPRRGTAKWEDAVTIYQESRTLSRSDERYIKRLGEVFGGKLLKDIKLKDIALAANRLYGGCLEQTKNRQAYVPAAAVLHYAAKNDYCEYIRIEKLRETEPETSAIYPEDMDLLIENTEGAMRALLETLAYQGWRITETLLTRREHFDFPGKRINRWISKSRRWKWTPLEDGVAEVLEALPPRPDGYVFPWRDRNNFYRALRPVLDRLGVYYTPHMSRHGFATALIEEGTDLKSIMEAGGWEDMKSVERYAHADVEQARRTIAKLRRRKDKTGAKKRRKLTK